MQTEADVFEAFRTPRRNAGCVSGARRCQPFHFIPERFGKFSNSLEGGGLVGAGGFLNANHVVSGAEKPANHGLSTPIVWQDFKSIKTVFSTTGSPDSGPKEHV